MFRREHLQVVRSELLTSALSTRVPATRIVEIVHERRRITAETALGTRHSLGESGRLARYFHTNPEFWLNLQNFYDLELSKRSGKASEIERQIQPSLATTSQLSR